MSKLGYSGAGATSGLSNTLKKDKFQVNRSCGAMDNASDYEIAGSYPAAARNANIFIALFTNYMIEYYLDFYLFLLGAACLFVSYSGVLIALNVHCSICNRKTSKLEPLYSEPEPHNRFRSVVQYISKGPVAQWITRLTTDQKIAGSNPARIVMFSYRSIVKVGHSKPK